MKIQRLGKAATLFAAGVTLLVAGSRAGADITGYTNRATFLSVAKSPTNIDFEGITGSAIFYDDSSGTTIDGVNFVGQPDNNISYRLVAINSSVEGNEYKDGSDGVLSGPGGNTVAAPGKIVATLPAGIHAAGADMFPYDGVITDLTVMLSTGETIVITGAGDSHTTVPHTEYFAGFVSDADISSISFRVSNTGGALINLDNFVFSSEVPEPASAAALLGLIGGVSLRRRRR